MKDQLIAIRVKAIEAVGKASSIDEIENLRVQVLGRKGELTQILRTLGSMSAEERSEIGKLSNEVKAEIESAIDARKITIEAESIAKKLSEDWLDVSLPSSQGDETFTRGRLHPKWGVDPDAFSQNSYDAANILIGAIEKVYNESSDSDKKAWKLDREKILEAVAATKEFPGVSGKITFTNNDVRKAVGIYKTENNGTVLLKKYTLDENNNLVIVK
jgi:hypothetical protein